MRKIKLTPGNFGRDCLYNGMNFDNKGRIIECCCDECDFLICCVENIRDEDCLGCVTAKCPNRQKVNKKSW